MLPAAPLSWWILAFTWHVLCYPAVSLAHDGIHARLARADTVIAEDPGQAQLWVQRADLLREHGDMSLAWADLRRARSLPGGAAEVLFVEALLARDLGWSHLARRRITEHLALHPQDGVGHVLHGELLASLGRKAAALEAYQRALETHEAPAPDLYLAAAATLKNQGDPGLEAGLVLIEEGLQRLGDLVSLQLEAIDLEVGLCRPDQALARLDALIAASPRPERWLVQKGDLLLDAGRGGAARAAYLAAQAALRAGGQRRSHTAAAAALQQHIEACLQDPPLDRATVRTAPSSNHTPSSTQTAAHPGTKDRHP